MFVPLRDRQKTRTVAFVTYAIIAFNVLAFLWESALLESGYSSVVFDWGLVPRRFFVAPIAEVPTIFTSMFMHGGWMHLVGNMWFFWIFGDNVEDALGHLRYAGFYVLGGLSAAALQLAIEPGSRLPMVGASGAIAAVLAAYLTLYPRAPIVVLNPIFWLWFSFGAFIDLPAWVVAAEFFLVNLFGGFGTLGGPRGAESGGVAFFAHLGGFVAGLVLVRLFMIGRPRREVDAWGGWRPPRPPPPSAGPWGPPRTPYN